MASNASLDEAFPVVFNYIPFPEGGHLRVAI